jgi:hypothetical protein
MHAMLHVTNGDSAVAALAAAGIEDALPWRDILHEGPVPNVPEPDLRRIRAHFLAKAYGLDRAQVLREMQERDERLATADEVVLWFESDLYDDLQRMQISHQLGGRTAYLVLVDDTPWRGVVHLTLDEIKHAQAVEAPDLREEWAAVRDQDPRGVTHERYKQEFPWTTDGLSRSERQLVEAGGDFMKAQAMEEKPFLGDTTAAILFARAKDPARKYSLGGAMATNWRYDPVTDEVRPASGA